MRAATASSNDMSMRNTSQGFSAVAGVLLLLLTASAGAQQAEHGHGSHAGREAPYSAHYDTQFNHNHYYTTRGIEVTAVPGRPYVVAHGGVHYYYSGGVWYAPRGPTFVVVGPPVGVFVPVLPLIRAARLPVRRDRSTPARRRRPRTGHRRRGKTSSSIHNAANRRSSRRMTGTSVTSGRRRRPVSTRPRLAVAWPPTRPSPGAKITGAPCGPASRAGATAYGRNQPRP